MFENYCVESVHHEFVRCFPRLVDMSLKFLDLSIEDSWRGGGAGEASGGTRDSDTSVAAGATDFSSAGVSYDEELRKSHVHFKVFASMNECFEGL